MIPTSDEESPSRNSRRLAIEHLTDEPKCINTSSTQRLNRRAGMKKVQLETMCCQVAKVTTSLGGDEEVKNGGNVGEDEGEEEESPQEVVNEEGQVEDEEALVDEMICDLDTVRIKVENITGI